MKLNELPDSKPSINVHGLDFQWDFNNGQFIFEGEDAVLFWINSAMKTFFDTIEEISGEEAASVVLETTGYRMGQVVGEYFEKLKSVSVEDATKLIPNTYASAGWGKTVVTELDEEAKTVTVQMQDTWEHKINLAQNKKTGGTFLPAHYAGIFTGLFGENIWYEVAESQIEGHDYTEVRYFPSSVTISQNIHELSRRKESEQIRSLEALVEEQTMELHDLVRQLSSPIIPVLEGIVVVPLIGKYDESRSEDLLTKTLNNLPKYQAGYLVLDLTGLDQDISNFTGDFIHKLGSAASLIGIDTILVGISAELGVAITQSGIKLSKYDCFQTLQHGIYFALSQIGRRII
jgi:rsbT co-antagonist protein RsbR